MFALGSNDPQWVMHVGFGSCADFCIWILERDGLQVPPFTFHPEGDRRLRDVGMRAESWFVWLTRVILLQDQRLNWRVEDPPTDAIELKPPRYGDVAALAQTWFPDSPLQPFDTDPPVIQHQQFLNWQLSHYEQALAAARQVFGDGQLPCRSTPPSELWQGEMGVQELLREMWVFYRSNVFNYRQQQFIDNEQEYSSSSTYAKLAPPRSQVAALELYFVLYPELVELSIPPASAVLSVRSTQSQLPLADRVINASERLVELNSLM